MTDGMKKAAAENEGMSARLKMSGKMSQVRRQYRSVEELIRAAGGTAVALGYAEEGFIEDVIQREREYPTGLNAVMPIAIPHVSTHCIDSFMCVVTLEEPLLFEPMDGLGDALPVQIVFMFGLLDHRDQVKVLKRLAQMFKDKEALERLRGAETDEAGCSIVAEYLGELVEIV